MNDECFVTNSLNYIAAFPLVPLTCATVHHIHPHGVRLALIIVGAAIAAADGRVIVRTCSRLFHAGPVLHRDPGLARSEADAAEVARGAGVLINAVVGAVDLDLAPARALVVHAHAA